MALNKKKLESGLKKVLDSSFDNFVDAADAWANAYVGYAQDAQSCLGAALLKPNVEIGRKTLKGSLSAVFASTITPVDWGTNVGISMAIFWTLPPLPFVSSPSLPGAILPEPTINGVFTAALIKYIIKNQVASLSGNPIKTGPAAKDLADALHTATTTIKSAHVGTGGCTDFIT